MFDDTKARLDRLLAWAKSEPEAAHEALDDMVSECKASEASSINNEGFSGQLSYLSFQLGIDHLEKCLLPQRPDEKEFTVVVRRVVREDISVNVRAFDRAGAARAAELEAQCRDSAEWETYDCTYSVDVNEVEEIKP